VLRDCSATLQHISGAVFELREAIVERVGEDQMDRLRRALTKANNAKGAPKRLGCDRATARRPFLMT